MKTSLNWLNQYIDLKDFRNNLSELSSLLTKAGLEVEEMQNPAEGWDKVVVGKLLEVGQHPDADKLTLCQVDVGKGENLQIVCGAKNHKRGDLVAVAQVGAVLPGNFKIKKSKIRGVESFGMLCSESELALAEESDGILILSDNLKVGTPLSDVDELADIIFELNVTPNRADCLSHLGLARELSSLLDRPLQKPQKNYEEQGKSINDWIHVELKDSDGCPRYCGKMISDVKVGPSPSWLKNALQSIGLNSVNNIVDVTNYVLFEFGQPLHAFDYDEIKNAQIKIERAKDQESFVTLDGTEVKLNATDLVIRDGERPVALAGVVGGQNSGVSEKTKNIFLESAFFKSEGVRKTSRLHGIETDSCYRFSRGVDPEQTLNAMERATSLIVEVAGGKVQTGQIDIYPEPVRAQKIEVTSQYVAQRLGYKVEDESLKNWLERLNCSVSMKEGVLTVVPPTYRFDISIKEDLVEEYARVNGYDKIEERLPVLASEPTGHNFDYEFSHKVSDLLTGLGVQQALNYAFIGEGQSEEIWKAQGQDQFGLKFSSQSVKLVNPISEELSVMRESLLPSLFKNLVYNDRHGNSVGRLFELSSCHQKLKEGFGEEKRLAMVFWGALEGLWKTKKKNEVVFELKSTVETMLRSLGAKSWRWDKVSVENCPPGFHPSQSVSLFYEGQIIGLLGTMHPLLQSKNKLRQEVAWVELNFESLSRRQPRVPKFKALAKYPAVERDIALLADESIAASDMSSEIKKSAGPLLVHHEIFDIYQDKELKEAGRRSIAFRLRFQSSEETLKDDKVNQIRDKIVNSLCQKLGLEIR